VPGISANATFGERENRSSAPTGCDEGTARVSPDGTRVACAIEGTELLIGDPVSRSTRRITSGLSSDLHPAACRRAD
jgi:hypothetical protein